MNQIWEILGIEPTDSEQEIHAAYAAQEKLHHMEEEPEAFEKLHRAYQEALKYAAGGAQMAERLHTGALKQFTAIWEKAKAVGKVPRREVWKEFFLSEEFLKEQYSDEFAEGMMQYLSDLEIEGNYRLQTLPDHFLIELAIAYALLPEPVQVHADGSFYARETAARLWNMQEKAYMPVRLLYKPENKVRLRSFSDYMRLREMNQNHALTSDNRRVWERLLMCGCVNHMYELRGRGSMEIYEETRSTCLIALYIFWIQVEKVPDCVLEYMYKEYDLKNIEHTSSRRLYAPLKQAILKQHPRVEEELFGAESQTQLISGWYRELMKIVSDHHSDYDKGIYEETSKTKERLQALFARPEWPKIQYSRELFEKMYPQFYNRKVVPVSLAEYLIGFYSQEGIWEDARVPIVQEGLIQSLGFSRMMKEIDGLERLSYKKTRVEDISDENKDFWQYYLMRGFGFRESDMGDGGRSTAYSHGSRYSLPAYIRAMYYPSLQWQKLFTGYREDGGFESVSIEITLLDTRKLKVEFHLHYCLYFLDGKPVYKPEYTFIECAALAEHMENWQRFFLLAVTAIREEERSFARERIEQWLELLPLYPLTIPVIARLLAEDNGRERDEKEVQAVYYVEQEDFCCRAVVTDERVSLYQQKEFDWSEMDIHSLLEDSTRMESEDKKEQAEELLLKLRQPRPVSSRIVSLEGMDNEQKAAAVLEILKRPETCIGNTDGLAPPVREFFQKEGNFLTESYCVLRYGEEKKNERLFYCAMNPFAFELSAQNPEFYGKGAYRINELNRKIKEEHWIIGRFGWGDVYTPKSEFLPELFAIGAGGTYYHYGAFRMHREQNLTALLAKMFDFSNVTEVESYQGMLSISRLRHRLEYCYDEKDFRESVYTPALTAADFFTNFTKAEMMAEFARWMDEVLADETCRFHMAYFEMTWVKGNLFIMDVYDQTAYECLKKEKEQNRSRLQPKDGRRIVWKIWKDNMGFYTAMEEFGDILKWYMEQGAFGWKLKSCLRVDTGWKFDGADAVQQMIYKNSSGILEAVKRRTAMTAYFLTVSSKRTPELLDSKFGGMPYWQPGREYPTDSGGKKLLLVAQINLDRDPMPEVIPGGGMLQFFGAGEEIFSAGFGAWENGDKYRVIYHESVDDTISREELKALGIPDSTSKEYQVHMPISVERAVDIEKKTACMGKEDYRFDALFRSVIEEDFGVSLHGLEDPYEEILDECEQWDMEDELLNASHWILGYPDFVKYDPRESHPALRRYDRQLFQFDVHYLEDQYYNFDKSHGCGIASFFISSEDLQKHDFDRILYYWECCMQYEEDEYGYDDEDEDYED